uniref:oligosaccharide flippase family protein n=1 Tax=Agathobacter sp. TaxID=2021311 RepID=UPI0040576EEF
MSSAGIISRILGFFYKIFLSRAIGASGLGLYQLIFPIFSLCLAISTSGIQTAISRFVAIEMSGRPAFSLREKNARRYLYSGLLVSTCLCGIFAVCVHTFAPWISNVILKEPRTEELLRAMSLTFIPAAIHSCFNGYFYGKKNSVVPSVCQILEQIARVGATLLIYTVLSSRNLPLFAIHAVWGLVISEFMGLLVCLTGFLGQNTKEPSENDLHDFEKTAPLPIKALLCMAIPLSLNHVLMSLSNSVENMLIPQQLMAFGFTSDEALSHFGILTGMALSVIFFPAVITNSLSVLLLPRISEAKAKNDTALVMDTIKGAAACGIAFGSLCTFLFLFSADWIGKYVFDNTMAGFYVQILSILCPFMYTSALLSSIVNGLGYAHLTLLCNISGCLLRIAAIWFFVPEYGMYAYILSLIAAALLTTVELAGVVTYVVRSHANVP